MGNSRPVVVLLCTSVLLTVQDSGMSSRASGVCA
jgi:hypothetical protein